MNNRVGKNSKSQMAKEPNLWNPNDIPSLGPVSSSEVDSIVFMLKVFKVTQEIESGEWIKLRDALKNLLTKNGLDPEVKMAGLL